MTDKEKSAMVKTSWELHSLVEKAYLNHPASSNDEDWLEKQRYLLADMALHLLQTSVKPGPIELERLRDNLHAIITISDKFIPESELTTGLKKLYTK